MTEEEGPAPRIQSWWLPKYPPHKCQTCDWEHCKIPPLRVVQRIEEEDVPVECAPFEILGVMGGGSSPGHEHACEVNDGILKPDTRVQVIALFWGLPGSSQPLEPQPRILMMN